MNEQRYPVGVVQAAPEYLDLSASVDKAVALIAQAAKEGARLLAFPEVWLPGYPWWIWLDEQERPALVQRYMAQAFTQDSPAARAIAQAAAAHRIHVVMGMAERDGDQLYIAQWLVDPRGVTLLKRRKVKPGPLELRVFAEGGVYDLPVVDTDLGRVGALACAEHRHPLLKHAMHLQGETLHVAAWPSFSLAETPNMPSPDTFLAISRTYAVEGGCYVLAPCAPVTPQMRDRVCETPAQAARLQAGGGYAQIFGPTGDPLCQPLPPDAEGILLAEVSPAAVTRARKGFDLAGHSACSDLVWLGGPLSRRGNP